MQRFLSELKRRKVVNSLVAYVGISWLILQVVGVVSSMIEINPLVGPAILLLLSCGLPVAMYLSWHFDISLQGIKRTPSLDLEQNPTIKPFGIWSWMGLMFVVLVSGFIGVQYFSSIKDEQLAKQEGLSQIKHADSIAVLPFIDQSPEQDQAYLAVGLAEELTSLLGRSTGFTVTASRSSQVLAEKGLTPVDIGRRLKVQTVLSGSVRASGNRLKIQVELLDTENGHTLWTESFLRELKDVFELQSEIGRAVVNLLQDKYLEAGTFKTFSSTNSTDAYVMYLKGREEYRKQTTESMKAARKLFEQAVALDPEYAMGYVGLADTLVLLAEGETRFGVLKTDIAATLAQQNIDKALVRQPQMAEAYAVNGYIGYMQDDFDRAIANYDKAIQLNPSLAIAYMWKFLALKDLRRFDESLVVLQKAQSLDPLFFTSTYNLGLALSHRGRFKEAEKIFKQLRLDYPDSPFSYQGLADIYYSQGDYAGAIREGKKAVRLSPDNVELTDKLIGPLLALGLPEIAKTITEDPKWDVNILIAEKKYDELFKKMNFDVAANPDDYWLAFEAGWYYAMFGDKQRALTLITEKENLLQESDKFAMPWCSPAIEIAWAYKELSHIKDYLNLESKCDALLEEQRQASISFFEVDYLAARIYALEGKSSQAIQALSTSIDKGWREWWTKYDPLLESLKDQPEFQKLIQFIDDDLARQRQEVRVLFTD
ncbi:tetratricopeptide repeat protein [Neptunicella sp.]|uniref:tetratricopeptide repeat protein n=1 Tax=Neptunicella sp. TaxID=2125986 RepID=UPI003F690622